MLRNMFWTGLKQSFKDIVGHKYDFIGNFDKLRTAIRIIENEHIESATQDQPRSGKLLTKLWLQFQNLILKDCEMK